MNLPKHIEELQEPYNQIDHTHCFTHNNPPCGQKIKHFECCLCQKLNPEIAQILEEEKERIVGEIVDKMNEYRMRECPMKGRMSQCTKDMCFHWTPSWQDIINLIKK